MKDIFEEVDDERVTKAKERMEKLKARYTDEVRNANKKRRSIATHHKIVMGGIVAKFFPECYQFEELELQKILKAGIDTAEFKRAVEEVKRSAGYGAKERPSGRRSESAESEVINDEE